MTLSLPGNVTLSMARWSRVGVRARLWGTMAVLALLPIASGGVAWRAFEAFDHAITEVVDDKLPQIEGALLLARDGDRLVLGGAGLASAATEEARQTQQGLVADEIKRAAERLQRLRAGGLSEAAAQATEAALQQLQANTAAIDRLVGDTLDTRTKMAALQQAVLGLGGRLSRALEPISAEQRNTMNGFISTLSGSADTAQRQHATEGLQGVADATRALGRLGAANATLQSTIAQIPLASDPKTLDRLTQTVRRDLATLTAALDDLDENSTSTLLPLVEEWDQVGKSNPVMLRRTQLDLAAQLQALASTNKDLSDRLSAAIEAGVQRAKADTAQATGEARQLTNTSGKLLLGVASVGLFLASLLSWLYVGRGVINRLTQLERAMRRLADGHLDVSLPAASHDEIGAMGEALAVLKAGAIERRRLEIAQAEQRDRADAEKVTALVGMAETVETRMAAALSHIGSRTAAMTATAKQMSASATRTGGSARNAATASAQALATVQTVASAADQLAASIREIGGQVAHSTEVVGRAVDAGNTARATIVRLNEQVARIGAVADMIGEIAAKTNLLALNATIEAARAGDAGRGFAVVASEVKMLATQTARSTEEIGRHIAEVRAATGASVAAVTQIEHTIGRIDAIAGSIAAAVEQQGAATAEIARNITETATAANEMRSRTTEVSGEAEETGRHAVEVQDNAAALDLAVGDLRQSVIEVVRTATIEVGVPPAMLRFGTVPKACQ